MTRIDTLVGNGYKFRRHPKFRMQPRTLINPNEALKILTWCSRSALDSGKHGTNDLTRVIQSGHTYFVREECEALAKRIFHDGLGPEKEKALGH